MTGSPITQHTPKSPKEGDENPAGEKGEDATPTADQQRQMEQAFSQMKRKMTIQEMGDKIKHKIMVLSGKGGVGKSSGATGLALSLANQGNTVGLLDIDITGPNVPKMLGLGGHRLNVEGGRIFPAVGQGGVKVISMAFLLESDDTPVVWRGPIKLGAIQQFIGDVEWGDLDYLVIDFPPGSSDEPLTVAQSLPDIDGMVIVTTPQEVALLDSRKSVGFANSLKVPVIGIIENMSGYTIHGTAQANQTISVTGPTNEKIETTANEAGDWSVTLDIFKQGGGQTTAEEMDVPFLGRLPFDPGVIRGGDDGVHRIVAQPEGESAIAFASIVEAIKKQIKENKDSQASSGLEII